MAKRLLPSRRGPGRGAQREKPGDAIRAMFAQNPKGITIGDCHRFYTARKLQDWQKEEIAKIAGSTREEVAFGDIQDLLSQKAIRMHPRSPSKQMAFVTRKMKTVDKIMARKRAPNTVTYEGFSRFFHLLVQRGYIRHLTEKNPVTGKVSSQRRAPQMRGADGDMILEDKAAGRQPQIEPPAVYIITDLGWSIENWNNPWKELV